MFKKILIVAGILLLVFLLLGALSSQDKDTSHQESNTPIATDADREYKDMEGRLSATVSFEYSDPRVQEWLQEPGLAFIESYVYFTDDISDSAVFGIDMELFEGMTDPIRFKGADWMALIGLQRDGKVWIASGPESVLDGKETSFDNKWKFDDIGQALRPNTWYKLKTIADFENIEYVSFTVEGPGIQKTLDLSGMRLDYPNKAVFEHRTLTHYVWTIDGAALGGSQEKSSSAYFDDIRYGLIDTQGGALEEITIHTDNLESTGNSFDVQPASLSLTWDGLIIPLADYEERTWYLERDESLTRPIEKPFARSGTKVIEADAEVRDISLEEWLSL